MQMKCRYKFQKELTQRTKDKVLFYITKNEKVNWTDPGVDN